MVRASVRDQIFEAAQAEFHERGYTATGIAAITERASAHKGSFYNHFSSKEELAVETLRVYGASQRLDMLEDKALSAADRVRTHFEFLAEAIASAPVINGCMVANFSAEVSDDMPLIREQIADIYRSWSARVAKNLDEAARSAGVKGVNAKALAWSLLDSYEGAALRSRSTQSGAPLRNFVDSTLPLVLAAVTGAH